MNAPIVYESGPYVIHVRGDKTPPTTEEWYCAKLLREMFQQHLVIHVLPGRTYVGNEDCYGATSAQRVEATLMCTQLLSDVVLDRLRVAYFLEQDYRSLGCADADTAAAQCDARGEHLRGLLREGNRGR